MLINIQFPGSDPCPPFTHIYTICCDFEKNNLEMYFSFVFQFQTNGVIFGFFAIYPCDFFSAVVIIDHGS